MFDDPGARFDGNSISARDINAADGQQLVAGATFFGESTFGSGNLNDVVVLFKSNSIYVYDTSTQEYQKLDSRGLGCTAPKSVSTTRNGIMFANESGIYRLNRNLSVSYVGELLEKVWNDIVNQDRIDEMVGHQYYNDRKYKLSVPVNSGLYNTQALVYDHDTEGKGQEYGAWTKYTQHNATMWANLNKDAFFGSHKGQVYRIRTAGDASDFRDDEVSIPIEWRGRAEDFGVNSRRKLVHKAFLELQLDHTDITGVSVYSRTNLSGDFTAAGTITETQSDNTYIPVRISLADRKGVNTQLKITHDMIDEEIVITGLGWLVDGLESTGITEAAKY